MTDYNDLTIRSNFHVKTKIAADNVAARLEWAVHYAERGEAEQAKEWMKRAAEYLEYAQGQLDH